MWILLAFALVATASASPAPRYQDVTYHNQLLSGNGKMSQQVMISSLVDNLKESCQRYGDATSFNHFIEVRDGFILDVQTAAIVEAVAMVEKGEHRNRVKLFCGLKPTIKTGVSRMITALKPCVQPEDRETMNVGLNITDSVMDYACHNEGQRVTTFINERGVECVKEQYLEISKCVDNIFGDKIQRLDDGVFSNIIDESYDSFRKQDREVKRRNECRQLFNLQRCVKNKLQQCPNASTANFVNGMVESTIMPICRQYKVQ